MYRLAPDVRDSEPALMVPSHSSTTESSAATVWTSASAASVADDVFRSIIESIPVLLWAARPDGSVELFSKQWLDYAGVTADAVLDGAWMAVVHPDDRDRVLDYWRCVVASGEPGEIEARMRRFDGMYRWFLIRCNAQRDDSGRIVRWYGTNTDIEDRRNAELIGHERELSFRQILDNIPGLVFTTTPAGEVDFINGQLLEYFDRPLEQLRGWLAEGAIHSDDVPRVMAHWARAVQAGKPSEIELRLRRGDGIYRWFHYRAAPLHDDQGTIIRWCVLATDVDDTRRAEEVLRATQARLSRAMHVASLSELSASIAHEINQPLAAVVANGHASRRWLSSEPPNVERALMSADRIVRDGNAAAEVVRRIRCLFSRLPPSKHLLNMNDVVHDVCELMANELRTKGVELKVDLQPDLPLTLVDRVQMQQVLANLMRNGAEAMDGVTDRIRLLSVSSRSSGDEVVVHVADSGIGIRDTQAIFESFYTTKPDGMGMGLSICRSIVEAHGGRLWASKGAHHGATFTFALEAAAHRTRHADADDSGTSLSTG